MSIRDVFDYIINYDLTNLPEIIISLSIVAVIIFIGYVVIRAIYVSTIDYFSNNKSGKKIFDISKKILLRLFFVVILLMIIFAFIGEFLITLFF